MRPVPFSAVNRLFKGGEDFIDVPAKVDDATGVVTTVWQLSFEERAAILSGAPVVLHTISQGQMFPTALVVLGADNNEGKEEDEE